MHLNGGYPPPHRGYLAMSGDLSVVIPGRRKRMVAPGIWWVELRDAGVTILQITGWPDKKKNLAPGVSSAKVGPCSKGLMGLGWRAPCHFTWGLKKRGRGLWTARWTPEPLYSAQEFCSRISAPFGFSVDEAGTSLECCLLHYVLFIYHHLRVYGLFENL